jgi:hypothetical protein
MNIAPRPSFVLNRRHLLGIEGLSREEISGLLDLAEEFVDLNRQIETAFEPAPPASTPLIGLCSIPYVYRNAIHLVDPLCRTPRPETPCQRSAIIGALKA